LINVLGLRKTKLIFLYGFPYHESSFAAEQLLILEHCKMSTARIELLNHFTRSYYVVSDSSDLVGRALSRVFLLDIGKKFLNSKKKKKEVFFYCLS